MPAGPAGQTGNFAQLDTEPPRGNVLGRNGFNHPKLRCARSVDFPVLAMCFRALPLTPCSYRMELRLPGRVTQSMALLRPASLLSLITSAVATSRTLRGPLCLVRDSRMGWEYTSATS